MKNILNYMRNNFLTIGAMSGTSADGIDISLIETDGLNYFKPIKNVSIAYKKNLKKMILNLSRKFKNKTYHYQIIRIEQMITTNYIIGIEKLLKSSKVKIEDITIVGLHGQTIYHEPTRYISLQLINSKKISEHFKIKVISDFRENDIIRGGEGAPLVPIFHKVLMKYLKINEPTIFINIGGISNITYVDSKNLIAFDTGPGMCLLDDYVNKNSNNNFDYGGKFSNKGNVSKKIISQNMLDKFFKKRYPKSIDRNYFSLNVYSQLDFFDACSTISMFTAFSIFNGIKKLNKKYKNIYIMGGGSKNLFILRELSKLTKVQVKSINTKKLSEKYIESQAFAYLAIRSLKKLPISFPNTTGVIKSSRGGKIFHLSKP